MFKNEEGFSLLELVVAVGVAGIIAAVALPTFAGLQDKASQNSATYAASASAAEALANSTIGTTGSSSSNGGSASSSQAAAVTITGLTIQGYNNANVIWTAATASNGEPVIYTVFTTSSSAAIMQPTLSTLAQEVAPWTFSSGTSTLLHDAANGTYAFSRLEFDGDGNYVADRYGDVTIVASLASNPSVTQTVVNF